MLTYTQIEAIHEAMREMDHAIGDGYSDDVALCLFVARRLAKIRAALAGETNPVQTDEDSKITWQG